MRPHSSFHVLLGLAGRLLALAAVVSTPAAAASASAETTSATGPSWIEHLGRPYDASALGRVGALGPEQQDALLQAPAPTGGTWLREGFAVRGADLYRFTCRACHGAAGVGSLPEIRPLVDVVRTTSGELQQGGGTAAEVASRRAAAAEQLLRHRIAEGGPAMPAFDLTADEEEILLAYLERLATVPDPRHRDDTLRMPVDRVGERIVKGTCQICHAARAQAGRPAKDPSLVPLETMTSTAAVRPFLALARHQGKPSRAGRGPQLTYLRDAELEAAYFYLTAYPPK